MINNKAKTEAELLNKQYKKHYNQSKSITILVDDKIPQETLCYIADCWIDFVIGDLGLLPSDLMMILPLA